MNLGELKRLSPLRRLIYWIDERESVRLKKEAGEPPPWTDDPILQRYRFCNVRRMDDKVSRWLLEHWYGPHQDHHNLLAAACLARHFNLPFTLHAVGGLMFVRGRPDLCAIGQVIRSLKKAGYKVFNGAYMVRGIGTADKTEMVLERVCRPLLEHPPALDPDSMQRSVEALLPYWGFSTFMAGQVVADLRWSLSGRWKDRLTWAPPGPGSLRGLNRLANRPVGQRFKEGQFQEELVKMMSAARPLLPGSITNRLEAMDWQNCLCEWDKMERAVWEEGRPKQLYRAGQGG